MQGIVWTSTCPSWWGCSFPLCKTAINWLHSYTSPSLAFVRHSSRTRRQARAKLYSEQLPPTETSFRGERSLHATSSTLLGMQTMAKPLLKGLRRPEG
jgi:hypothetical protein